MSNKFFIGIGVAFLAVFALGISAVVSVNSVADRAAVATPVAATPSETPSLPSPAPEVPSVATQVPAVVPATPTAVSSPAVPVLDSDIATLALAVKLGQPNTGGVSKEVWSRETPIAEKLLKGLCDCDQRNWLKHFVKTGNEALSGSQNYYQSIQELAQLRRNNQDLTSVQASH